jgi:hypothetical protein
MSLILAAIICVVLFIGLSIFQFLLAIGLPLGRFAYGGKYETLPKNLRIISIVAIGIFVFGLISVLIQVGVITIIPNSILFDIVVWVLAFYLSLNTLANLASKSKSEKLVMTPISLSLAICLFIVAIAF